MDQETGRTSPVFQQSVHNMAADEPGTASSEDFQAYLVAMQRDAARYPSR